MIYEVTERLSFGAQEDCLLETQNNARAIIHACKHPCHRKAVRYENNLPANHPNYLSFERGHHLYLNLIDPPVPLFKLESFKIFFDFADRQIVTRPLLIHCNKGESRAPSLALLYMAKRLDLLPNDN